MIPRDKVLHLCAGALAFLAGFIVTGDAGLGCVAAIAAGAGKELYDLGNRDRHTPDLWDFLATSAPGVVLLVAVVLWQGVSQFSA